jgi:hypothetical protein
VGPHKTNDLTGQGYELTKTLAAEKTLKKIKTRNLFCARIFGFRVNKIYFLKYKILTDIPKPYMYISQ